MIIYIGIGISAVVAAWLLLRRRAVTDQGVKALGQHVANEGARQEAHGISLTLSAERDATARQVVLTEEALRARAEALGADKQAVKDLTNPVPGVPLRRPGD